jgi:hypothetical protein
VMGKEGIVDYQKVIYDLPVQQKNEYWEAIERGTTAQYSVIIEVRIRLILEKKESIL